MDEQSEPAGPVVVVTGASSGIGLAIAQRFVSDGARVLTGSRTRPPGPDIAWLETDVADPSRAAALIDGAVATHGRVDVVVNNAGVQVEKTVAETTDDDYDLLMDVNVRGVFNVCRAAVRQMQRQTTGGSIINIGSIAGNTADHQMAVYNATKGAVHSLTRAIAVDHGPDGIRCNAIAPGWIETALADAAFDLAPDPQAARQAAVARHPVGRLGLPTEAKRPFHHQWLRHSCYCPECGNPADGIRFFTVNSFDSDISPADVEVADGNLMVRWPDGHESLYGHDWLVHHAYDDEGRARRHSLRPQTWKADLADRFPTVSFSDASDGSAGQLRLYELLRDFGIVRVSNLGTSPDQTEPLANLVGPIHQTTVYGHIYDVRAEPVARLGAKTGMAQAPHIDDAFYYSQPGIDVFHCLVNTDEGGLSTYVDGFAIAESIKADDPDAYLALTTLPVDHIRRHPDEIDLRSRGPLVSVDKNGLPCGIRYFDRALAPLDVAPDDVDRLYDGIRAFSRRMVSDEFTAAVRVAAGDGMLIDNHRVLHGRTAFDPTQGRHLRLCHVPRDEFHGRLRELSRKHSPSSHDLQLPTGSGSLSAG